MSGGSVTPRTAGVPSRPAGVTVITVVRDGVRTLERTIASVRAQTHADLEYLIVDGASTDGTVELIRRHGATLRWISEPDRGLYDAMNKGVALIDDPERYVMFLNADDVFASDEALARLLAATDGEDLLYGRIERHDEATGYRDVVGGEVAPEALAFRMIPHQTMLCRRRLFARLGGFDLRYRIAADYDWLRRLYADPAITRRFAPVVVATMARGGLSDQLYPRLVRERWAILRRRGSAADLAGYTVYAALVEVPKHAAQRVLRRLGWLDRARDLTGRWRGRTPRAGAPFA